MELMCVNDETGLGGAPYWSPPYDGINVPFPKCTVLCKYFRVRKRYKGMWNKKGKKVKICGLKNSEVTNKNCKSPKHGICEVKIGKSCYVD